VFVLGHSLGGVLAPRVAQAAPVAGVIAAAAPARPLEDALLEQAEYVARWRPGGEPELARLRGKIARVRAGDLTGDMPLGLPVEFWRDLRDHPLAGELARTSALPFLIVQGGRDYQATAADLAAWRELLRGRPADIREYPALDHLFMRGEGMATPKSYGVPGRVDRRLIDDVAGWILTH